MANKCLKLDTGLPTLNDIITASKSVRRGKYYSAYIPLKKKWTDRVAAELITQDCVPETPYKRIRLATTWVESAKKRDPDGLCAGLKFVLDAMVNVGIIPDDSRDYVVGLHNTFTVGTGKDRAVSVQIIEVIA